MALGDLGRLGLGLVKRGVAATGAPDTTPSAFTFTDRTSAALSTSYESNAITVSGIDAPATMTITGGQYQVNGGAWASSSTTVSSGNTVKVRGTSSASYSTAVNVTLTIGGVSDTFTITTSAAPDQTPNAFSFTDLTGQALSSTITGAAVTITGINTATPFTVTGGSVQINGTGSFVTSGNVNNNDTLTPRCTSSGSFSTAVNVVVNVNGVSDTWTVTTAAIDTTPNAFSFTDQTNASLSTSYESNAITVAGINSAATMTITGGEYQINGGSWASTSTTVVNGDSVKVRGTSSASNATAVNVALTIGGVSDTFTITTVSAFAHASTDATTGVVLNLWAADQSEEGAAFSLRLAADDTAIRVAVSTSSAMTSCVYSDAVSSSGQIARCSISGLTAGTLYYYALVKGTVLYTAFKGQFRTLPSGADSGAATSFKFALGSCWGTLVTPAIASQIAAHNPLFLFMMGDSPYLDEGGSMPNSRALRDAAMDVRLADDGYRLYQSQAVLYSWSDHDAFGSGATGLTVGSTLRNMAVQWFRDWYPHPLASSTVTDYVGWEMNIGRVRLLAPDCRSDQVNPFQAEGSAKTRLGAAQKTWLKSRLADAAANNKAVILYSEIPWLSSTDNDTWAGYTTERTELADYMKAQSLQGRLFIVAGDGHMVAIDSGANADYATGGGMDIPVFQAAPMGKANNVKGGTYSEGTFSSDNNQYGLVTITDPGGDFIHVQLEGYTDTPTRLDIYGFTMNVTGGAVDTTPSAFTLTDVTGATTSTDYVASVTPTGLDSVAKVTISGSGQFRIAGGAYGTGEQLWYPGQQIDVKVTSSGSSSTAVTATLDVNGVTDTFSVTTAGAPDQTPNAFSFTDLTGQALSSTITGAAVTITGINTATPFTVTGGSVQINGAGSFVTSGNVNNNDTLTPRCTSSGSFSTAVNVVVDVNGVSDTWTVTTAASDTTPNAFSFTDLTGQALSSTITGSAVTISGINDTTPFTVTGGTVQINGTGSFVSSGNVVNGDTLTPRCTSSSSNSTAVNVVVDVNGVSDTWTVTTLAAGGPPTIVQAGVFNYTGGTTTNTATFTFPSPATAGNRIIVLCGSDKARQTGFTVTSGYTSLGIDISGTGINVSVYEKIAVGGESSFTISWGGSALFPHIAMYEIAGSSALDLSATHNLSSSTATRAVTLSSAAPSVSDCLALAYFVNDSTNAFVSGFSWTNGFTVNDSNSDNVASGSWPYVNLAHKTLGAPAAISTVGDQGGGLADECIGILLVYKP